MNKLILLLVTLFSMSAFAAKDYQVTGPVTEITDTQITVQKGKESWTLSKDATTKLPADVKVGDKVTVYYSMAATKVEAKKK